MGKRKSSELMARICLQPDGLDPENPTDLILYVEIKQEGRWVRIAKRYSGESWISLEPGYTVRGSEPGTDYDCIEIEYQSANAMPQ
jgi:hypothetical protein